MAALRPGRRGALPLVLLAAAWAAGAASAAVHELTAATFEHDTQAATGQTTGHWLVLFTGAGSGAAQAAAERAWDELTSGEDDEAALEHTALFAKVDVARHPEVGRRFGLLSEAGLPAAILFRDRRMFRLPLPLPEGHGACAHLAMDFLAGGWQEADAEEVPPESAGRGGGSAGGGAGEAVRAFVSALVGTEVDAQEAYKVVSLAAGFLAVAVVGFMYAGGGRGVAARPAARLPPRGGPTAAGAAPSAPSQAGSGSGAAKRLSRKDRSA